MREARLWQWLRKRLPEGHFTRIESESSPGVPDVNYCVRGSEGWIELKASKPMRSGHPFRRKGLRPEQLRWIEKHLHHDGVIWIIASVGSQVYTIPGTQADEFNEMSVADLENASWWTADRRRASEAAMQRLIGLLEGST